MKDKTIKTIKGISIAVIIPYDSSNSHGPVFLD